MFTLVPFQLFTAISWRGLTVALLAIATSIRAEGDAVTLSPVHGFCTQPTDVRLDCAVAGAAIYFTTNGAEPSPTSGQRAVAAIRLRTTTVLRAAAFKDSARVSPTVVQTYVFLNDVWRQTGAGFPATWGTNEGKPVPADYEMDSEIVEHSAYRGALDTALTNIPTMSVTMEPDDLFGPVRGLYSHPKETGDEWERPALVEWLAVDGRAGFTVKCGIRIQGGWNRRPEESPKHSFRLLFKNKYGPAKLQFPLFGPEGPTEFDTVILRAGCNNSWLHWSGEERRRGEFIRDQWMRDTQRAMGRPSAAGCFVHLYLNGLYWGLYNLAERPSAPFAAAHFGGKAKDYDAMNAGKILEGDRTAWNLMLALANGGLAGVREYQEMQEFLDVPAFIDFLLVNFYGANADWDRSSNWYAARRRQPSGPFHFFVWDGERTLESVQDHTLAFDDDQSPPRLFQKLRANAEFRKLFAERAQRHLTGTGALTPAAAAQRYRRWADAIDAAVVAESARWGDYRRDAHRYKTGPYELYARDTHWRPEVKRLLEEYFPKRTEAVLQQLRDAGLAAPTEP